MKNAVYYARVSTSGQEEEGTIDSVAYIKTTESNTITAEAHIIPVNSTKPKLYKVINDLPKLYGAIM